MNTCLEGYAFVAFLLQVKTSIIRPSLGLKKNGLYTEVSIER